MNRNLVTDAYRRVSRPRASLTDGARELCQSAIDSLDSVLAGQSELTAEERTALEGARDAIKGVLGAENPVARALGNPTSIYRARSRA